MVGGVVGWRLRGVPAVVAAKVEVQRVEVERVREVAGPVRVERGPVRVVERWSVAAGPVSAPAPGCAPCPECVVHERVEERGVETTLRGVVVTETAVSARQEERSSVVVTPVARPGWAVTAGLQLLPDRQLELGLERRLLGPVWARAWVLQPAAAALPAVGVGLRVEW